MTVETKRWSGVSAGPGLYAMYGGEPPRTWVAYVGITGNIQGRLIQHFLRRDSSVVTGTAAAGLNIDAVRYVDWWEHELLADETGRHAAELIAFDVLDPALRSRGNPRQAALALRNDPAFVETITTLLRGQPTGRYQAPHLGSIADRLTDLEERVDELQRLLADRSADIADPLL